MKGKEKVVVNEIKVNSETGVREHIEHFDDFKVRSLTYDKRTKKYQFRSNIFRDNKFLEELTDKVLKLKEFPTPNDMDCIFINVSESDYDVIMERDMNCFLSRHLEKAIAIDPTKPQKAIVFNYGLSKVIDASDNWIKDLMRYLTSIKPGSNESGVFIRIKQNNKTLETIESETTEYFKNINRIAKDIFFSRFSQRFTYIQEVNTGLIWIYFDYDDIYHSSIHTNTSFHQWVFINLRLWIEAIDAIQLNEPFCCDLLIYRAKFEELKQEEIDGRLDF